MFAVSSFIKQDQISKSLKEQEVQEKGFKTLRYSRDRLFLKQIHQIQIVIPSLTSPSSIRSFHLPISDLSVTWITSPNKRVMTAAERRL